jgi:hypothetical protein
MSKIFSTIQDHQDALVQRFCSPKRRVIAETDWHGEDADIEGVKADCLRRILFFEERGFYLFQEPQIEHQPHKHRMRVLLTFKPTESNGPGG